MLAPPVYVAPVEDTVARVSRADSLREALERAVWSNELRTVELLIDQEGADANERNPQDGYAPLHWAVERGLFDMTRVLLQHGADVNLMTLGAIGKDRTPLHIAAELGHASLVEQLLGAGAHVNAATEYGETPLHGARLFVKDIHVIRELVAGGADVNKETIFGATPLHSASILGADDIVALLIESGAEVNHVNKRGLSPLHHAADNGHEAVVEVLLSSGLAELDIQTQNGDTALHLAAKKDHVGVVTLLLNAGADPQALNKFNKSPLAEAEDRSNSEAAALISGATLNGALLEKEKGF